MKPKLPLTVFGLFGTQLDRGVGPRRWDHWRPSLTLAQQADVEVQRLVLLGPTGHDARALLKDWRNLSPRTEVEYIPLDLPDPWSFEQVYEALLDASLDLCHNPDEGELWVHITTGTHVAQICLFLLVEAGFLPGKLVQTSPKNRQEGGSYQVIDLNLARYDRINTRFEAREVEATTMLKGGVETRSKGFNALISRIEQVALASTEPMLLTGPTGAGKSHLARRIYALKKQRRQLSGPLVQVNCATLRGDQAMSALFGHARGAFTGAVENRAGLLKAADGGLLFLDEVGELGLDEQAMLLRAIEDKRFLPVGLETETHSDVQLIAGTNRDLSRAVVEGQFRDDLLARIDLWHFDLPSLRERREDIAPNIDRELDRLTQALDKRVQFNAEGRRRFLRFAEAPDSAWTGNFRDLQAAMTRMATLAPKGRIGVHEVDEEITRLRRRWRAPEVGPSTGRIEALLGESARELDRFDRVQLEDVLDVCAGSKSMSAAGRTLFAMSRTRRSSVNDADRLRKYLGRYSLTWGDVSGG